MGRHALDRFREWVLRGSFSRAAAVDRQTGELLDSEARALFASLPLITPATSPEEWVSQGLVRRVPPGLREALTTPRYRPGRELFVRTETQFATRGGPVAGYQPGGRRAITHRATLLKRHGEMFMVEVAGAPTPLLFPANEVYRLNEPRGIPATGGTLTGVQVDYNDPLMRAHLAAAAIELGDAIAALDLSSPTPQTIEAQRRLVYRLASRVRMAYPGHGDGYAGHRAASLLSYGVGVCFVQRTVAAALLQPFARLLGFDLQLAVGRTLKHDVPHGFLIIMLRPSMLRWVCDPAWQEPATDLRVAFFDAGWGHDRRLVDFEGDAELSVSPLDVDLPEVEVA